jgi:hypothetical protein
MSPQDYYAAAIALFGIILFAKFVTHGGTATKWFALNKGWSGWVWTVLHILAVVAAVIGAASCLAVLGWAENSTPISPFGFKITEACLRRVVAIAAAFSGIILAFDIGITRRGNGDSTSQQIANPEPVKSAAEAGDKANKESSGNPRRR